MVTRTRDSCAAVLVDDLSILKTILEHLTQLLSVLPSSDKESPLSDKQVKDEISQNHHRQ
jgi:hypothetical protein